MICGVCGNAMWRDRRDADGCDWYVCVNRVCGSYMTARSDDGSVSEASISDIRGGAEAAVKEEGEETNV